MFYEKYIELCNKAKKRPYAVSKELGLSSSNVAQWKKGSTPRPQVLQRIADYFGVPVSYFYENDHSKRAPTETGEREMSDAELKFALWGGCDDVSDEDLADVRRYAAFVRERKKDRK